MRGRRWALLLALTVLPVQPVLAAGGGGGGGMSSMPSESAPAYDAAAEYAKGVAALKAGDFKAAERAARNALSVASRDLNTLILSGSAKAGAGDLKGAAKAFEKALKVDPNSLLARRELGIAHTRLGDAKGMSADLAALNERLAVCQGTCLENDDIKAAIAAVAAAATAAPAGTPTAALADPAAGDGAYLRAVGLINDRRYPEALAALRAAQIAFGPHPDVLTYIGYTYRKLGDYPRAETFYRQALAIAPEHRGATEYYGELKAERGDLAGARAMLAKLERACQFGCVEAEDLRRWIDARSL